MEKKVKKKKNNILSNENEISEDEKYKQIIDDYKKEIEKLKQTVENLENKNNEEISEKEKELNEREKEIIKKEQKINKKMKSLENKEKTLENLIKNMEIINQENNNLGKILLKEKDLKFKPIMYIFKPALIGLNNIGATCFMNATLQCLSQTKALSHYFLDEKNKDRIINNNISLTNNNQLQLSPAYLDLIYNLWDLNRPKSYSPNTFMNIINEMNPLFKKGEAGDSKDFIIFVLEQLHKELKKSINNNNLTQNMTLNQYDRNNAFLFFFNSFQKETSIISDLFFGFNETTNECLYCKNINNSQGLANPICYNYGTYNCLIFPLEEVKKMKNNSINNNNNNEVSLYDCFVYNQKSEHFTGDNQNYCNICKQLFDSIYTTKIFISLNVLVLILNRGKGNIYNVKLDFTETIDITQFVLNKDVPQMIYNLYGVITHIGQSGPYAHFVASCKSPIDDILIIMNHLIFYKIIHKEIYNLRLLFENHLLLYILYLHIYTIYYFYNFCKKQ